MKNRLTLAITVTCIALGILFLLGGAVIHLIVCSTEKDDVKDETENTVDSEENSAYPAFLYDNTWVSSEDYVECPETVRFTKDGEFTYSCACGNPVSDYDLYWNYEYSPKDRVITLSGDKTTPDDYVQVVFYDEFGLALRFSDKSVRTFASKKAEEPEIAYEYIKDAPLSVCITVEEDGLLTLVPSNYDEDSKKLFKGMVFEAALAKDAKISSVLVTVENGEEKIEVEELTLDEDTFVSEDNSNFYARVGFNEKGKIGKVVFYGVTVIED